MYKILTCLKVIFIGRSITGETTKQVAQFLKIYKNFYAFYTNQHEITGIKCGAKG
jgi:hypothetical protein